MNLKEAFIKSTKSMLAVYLFFILFVACSIFCPRFLTLGNLTRFLSSAAILSTLAIGKTFLIIAGHFDLSIGSILALSAGLSIATESHSIAFSVAVALLAGTALGFLNGVLVGKVGINSFVVTLAGMTGYRGLVYIVTGETGRLGTREAFSNFGKAQIGPIPVIMLVSIVLLVIAYFVLKYTQHGRNTYAMGGNETAAKEAGIRTDRTVILNFTIMGFCAAVAGVLFAAKLNVAVPYVGDDYVMMTIAAVVLGGAKLSGGTGKIVQTIFGVLSVQLIENAMSLLYLPEQYNNLVLGFVLLLVLYYGQRSADKKAREGGMRLKVGK